MHIYAVAWDCARFAGRPLRSQAWNEVVAASKTTVGAAVIATLLIWVLSALGSNFITRSLEAVLRTGAFVCIAVMVFAVLRDAPKLQSLCLKSLAAISLIPASNNALSRSSGSAISCTGCSSWSS